MGTATLLKAGRSLIHHSKIQFHLYEKRFTIDIPGSALETHAA
jgi:hypothetical protein